ncbi:MAG: DUF1003 domain-containing protein [Bryobacteraceae bacterium]|nr:DUF1003 domain-containing protein [Bryobacteraceae bacterium]
MAQEPVQRHVGLSKVLERNIRTITELRLKQARERGLQDRIADTVTAFSGSMPFVYLHIAWFLAWVAINSGRLGLPAFDPFPYGLLTMIVSLEAIFLSALVMITQNRQSDEAERRADLDLQIGLLAEHELTRVIKMLDAMQKKLGIEPDEDNELEDLEMETMPEDVLAEMDRLHRLERRG